MIYTRLLSFSLSLLLKVGEKLMAMDFLSLASPMRALCCIRKKGGRRFDSPGRLRMMDRGGGGGESFVFLLFFTCMRDGCV